jgi:hypothetical protein
MMRQVLPFVYLENYRDRVTGVEHRDGEVGVC